VRKDSREEISDERYRDPRTDEAVRPGGRTRRGAARSRSGGSTSSARRHGR
jgi:hypothetical protein